VRLGSGLTVRFAVNQSGSDTEVTTDLARKKIAQFCMPGNAWILAEIWGIGRESRGRWLVGELTVLYSPEWLCY
jgi:hypothetical protein